MVEKYRKKRSDYALLMTKELADGAKIIICIDNTVLGPAIGGTRFTDKNAFSFESAKTDAINLARAMTLKAAFIWPDYRLGGGKAVIWGDPEKKGNVYAPYGEMLNELNGDFIASIDVGFGTYDVEKLNSVTKYAFGIIKDRDPSCYTAHGCILAQKAALQAIYGSDSFKGRRLVIQGVGKVGFYLVAEAMDLGAVVIASDTDKNRREFAKSLGVEIVDPENIFRQAGDIFVPAARGDIVHDRTIRDLQCPIIAGPANNQLVVPERHSKMLKASGILFLPDFLISSGALMAIADSLDPFGFRSDRLENNIAKIRGRTEWIIAQSKEQERPPYEIAEEIACMRIELVRQANAACPV